MNFITNAIAAITASTSASGTGCAGRIRGLANSPRRGALLLLAGSLLIAASPPSPLQLTAPQATTPPLALAAELSVQLSGLRNTRGQILLCLTRANPRFLDCKNDKGAIALAVPTARAGRLTLPRVAPGDYVLLAVHDENGNGKVDMTFGIPREGFGFSRNPSMRMRPPRLDEVRVPLAAGSALMPVKLRYVL